MCICVEEASLKPGGYSWEFLVGMCRQVLQILTLFQTKQCHFPHPFSDLALLEIMSSLLRLERKRKNFSNAFRIRIFLFRFYSFGIERITTFVNFCSSLENQTRFQTQMDKVHTRFQTKKAQKPYPWGGKHLYVLYTGWHRSLRPSIVTTLSLL